MPPHPNSDYTPVIEMRSREVRVRGDSARTRLSIDARPLLPHPCQEAFHAGAFPPHQAEKFPGVETRSLRPEECFHAPPDVGRLPGTQAVALGDNPVIAQ